MIFLILIGCSGFVYAGNGTEETPSQNANNNIKSLSGECIPAEFYFETFGLNVLQVCKDPDGVATVKMTVDAFSDPGYITADIPLYLVSDLTGRCESSPKIVTLVDGEQVDSETQTKKFSNIVSLNVTKGVHEISFVGFEILAAPFPRNYCGAVYGYDSLYLPPSKQIENGVNPKVVKCNDDKRLVLKKSSEFHACVNPDSLVKLYSRGWALPEAPVIEEPDNANTITITGEIERIWSIEGLEFHFEPIDDEISKISHTDSDSVIMYATPETISYFNRYMDDKLVRVEGILLEHDAYTKNFSGLPILHVLNVLYIQSESIPNTQTENIEDEKLDLEKISFMKPDSAEFFYYPNPEETENRDAFETFMLIRLPEWLGGNVDDITSFRAYSALAVDDHCMVKYWPGEERQQIENPCRGGFYRVIDGAMTGTFGNAPGVQPVALPHLVLSTDETGQLYIEPPVWSKTKNGVLGYGREITNSEIEQGSMFLINSFAKANPEYPGIPLEFAGMILADIVQVEDERFKLLYSEFTPLAQNIEIYVAKCDCDELKEHRSYEEIEMIGNTTFAIHSTKIGSDDEPERIYEYHIRFAKAGFEYEVVGKNLDFIKSSIIAKLQN